MRLASALTVFIASITSSNAHPGAHGEVIGSSTALNHFVNSPFHLAIICLILIALGFLAFKIKKRKFSRNRTSFNAVRNNV